MGKTPRHPGDDNSLVTKADLKETKDDLRREVKLWVGIGLVGGQAAASLITSFVTSRTPLQQVEALAGLITQLF